MSLGKTNGSGGYSAGKPRAGNIAMQVGQVLYRARPERLEKPKPGLSQDIVFNRLQIGGQSLDEPVAPVGYGLGRITGPVAMLKSLSDRWRLSEDQLAILLGYEHSERQTIGKLLSGAVGMHGRDQKDRVRHLISIYALLQSVFNDAEVGYQWMTESKEALGGESPLTRMLKGSMEDLLIAKQLVETLAGR